MSIPRATLIGGGEGGFGAGPELAEGLRGGGFFAVEGGGDQREAFGNQRSLRVSEIGALAEAAELFLEQVGFDVRRDRVEDRDAMGAVEFGEFVECGCRRFAFVVGGPASERFAGRF